jgi:hypothetical protein
MSDHAKSERTAGLDVPAARGRGWWRMRTIGVVLLSAGAVGMLVVGVVGLFGDVVLLEWGVSKGMDDRGYRWNTKSCIRSQGGFVWYDYARRSSEFRSGSSEEYDGLLFKWCVGLEVDAVSVPGAVNPMAIGMRNVVRIAISAWCASLVLALYPIVLIVRGPVRRGIRRRRGRCERCGYKLTGLTEARCPECGKAFEFGPVGGADRRR